MVMLMLKKAKPEPPAEALSAIAEKIDLVGRLQDEALPIMLEIKALQDKLKPLYAAEKDLKEEVNKLGLDPDSEEAVELGSQYGAEIGKCGSSRRITDMDGVKKILGLALFMQLAKVNLGDLDKYMTLPQRDKVMTTDRTDRNYKIFKR